MRLFNKPGERIWTNSEIYEMAKLESLEAVQAKRQWAYLGHVLRRLEGNPYHELMKTFEKMTKRKKEDQEKIYLSKSERELGEEV